MTKIIVALDCSKDQAIHLAKQFDPKKCLLKVGLELFTFDQSIINVLIGMGFEVFLDLKLCDIPNTVSKTIKNICEMGVWGTTIHAMGGHEMMSAADDARTTNLKLIAVTVLTSLSSYQPYVHMGSYFEASMIVNVLTIAAYHNGMNGVVCSAHEVPSLKNITNTKFITICPGIRLHSDEVNDQKRVATPEFARQRGANYIVVGRSITNAKHPREILEKIYNSLNKD